MPTSSLLRPPDEFRGPVPQEDVDTGPYWESIRAHSMSIARCQQCNRWIHHPTPYCPDCHVDDVVFEPVSGRASIYTFAIVHREFGLGFDVPYVSAFVDLVEQPNLRLATNIVGCTIDEVRIGLDVEVVYHDYPNGLTLAYFTPVLDARIGAA